MNLWQNFGLLCLLGLCIGTSLFFGTTAIPAEQIWQALVGGAGSDPSAPPGWVETIVWQIRLPRVLCAALVGAGLASAGCALQGLFRNPLADPGVLGVSSGGALAAVLALYSGFATSWYWGLPAAAFLGSLATGFLVYRVASFGGRTALSTLILAGIAASTIAQAGLAWTLYLALEEFEVGRQIVHWSLGGVEGRAMSHAGLLLVPVLLGVLAFLYYGRDLDALSLGEAQAASLGVDVPRVRTHLITASALVVGATVAVAGVIGFVGLVIPHALRVMVGARHRLLIQACCWSGAVFLVVADLLARTLWAPKELRLGIITAAVGGPFFLALLLRRKRQGLL